MDAARPIPPANFLIFPEGVYINVPGMQRRKSPEFRLRLLPLDLQRLLYSTALDQNKTFAFFSLRLSRKNTYCTHMTAFVENLP